MDCNAETIIRDAYKRALWSLKWERRLRYTPQQLYCTNCSDRTFYLMAQEDGTLEAFCAKNNHKRTLVNVPELAQEVYGAIEQEIARALAGGSSEAQGTHQTAVHTQGEVNDAAVQHGTSADADSKSGV